MVRRENGSASRVTGAHGDAFGLGALLLLSSEWCANSCAIESSVAEQRRWSFGQRVAGFNNPLVCRNSRRSASMFVTRGSDKTFSGFHVDRRSRLVGRQCSIHSVESICALAATTLSRV